jgi:hypothetical protein
MLGQRRSQERGLDPNSGLVNCPRKRFLTSALFSRKVVRLTADLAES